MSALQVSQPPRGSSYPNKEGHRFRRVSGRGQLYYREGCPAQSQDRWRAQNQGQDLMFRILYETDRAMNRLPSPGKLEECIRRGGNRWVYENLIALICFSVFRVPLSNITFSKKNYKYCFELDHKEIHDIITNQHEPSMRLHPQKPSQVYVQPRWTVALQ